MPTGEGFPLDGGVYGGRAALVGAGTSGTSPPELSAALREMSSGKGLSSAVVCFLAGGFWSGLDGVVEDGDEFEEPAWELDAGCEEFDELEDFEFPEFEFEEFEFEEFESDEPGVFCGWLDGCCATSRGEPATRSAEAKARIESRKRIL